MKEKVKQEKQSVSYREMEREVTRDRRRNSKRLPEEIKPGRILKHNPDYEAILAVIEQEAGRKETDFT